MVSFDLNKKAFNISLNNMGDKLLLNFVAKF